ncbi:MAG TPA: GNAT family N-acetyltransferase [Flavobacterium sp.]|nr:GNAT family N-acetyltransferase [Flavobacterium sp.]
MTKDIHYRKAGLADSLKLSVLYKQVYIQTYGVEGVSDEFAHFITKQFSVERIEDAITRNPDYLIVAVYNENLVGVAEIEFSKKCPIGNIIAPELNKLYILEWFCGIGIGQKLMEFAENMLRAKGEKEMWLWVLISNTRAIRFYEKQGYKWIGNAFFQMETNNYENKVMLKTL